MNAGLVQLAGWENKGKDDKVFMNFTLQRSYQDEKEEWQNTNSLSVNDLPRAIALLQEAYKEYGLKKRD
jgi:hypothetical protein